jgi:hypothetical protein
MHTVAEAYVSIACFFYVRRIHIRAYTHTHTHTQTHTHTHTHIHIYTAAIVTLFVNLQVATLKRRCEMRVY